MMKKLIRVPSWGVRKERAKSKPNAEKIKRRTWKTCFSDEAIKQSTEKITKMSKSLEKTKKSLKELKENESKYPESDGYGEYSKASIERQKDRLDDTKWSWRCNKKTYKNRLSSD